MSWPERAGGYADNNADINGVRGRAPTASVRAKAMPLDKVDGGEAFLVQDQRRAADRG